MVIEDYTHIYKGKEHLKVDKFLDNVAFPDNFPDTSAMTIGAYSIFGGLSPDKFIIFLDSVAESLYPGINESGGNTEISDLKIIIEHKVNSYAKNNSRKDTVYTDTFHDVCFAYILFKIKQQLKKKSQPPAYHKNKREDINNTPFNIYIKNMPRVTQDDLDWSLIAINKTAQVAAIDTAHILSSLQSFINAITEKIDNPAILVSHVKEQIQITDPTLSYYIFEYVCQKIKLGLISAENQLMHRQDETGTQPANIPPQRNTGENNINFKEKLGKNPIPANLYSDKYKYIISFPGLNKIAGMIRPLFVERFRKICNEVYNLLQKDNTHTVMSIRLYIHSGFKDFFREYSIDSHKLKKDFYDSCYLAVSYVIQEMLRGKEYGIKALEITGPDITGKKRKKKKTSHINYILIFAIFIILGLLTLGILLIFGKPIISR